MAYVKIILILFLLPVKVFAQDITGVWTGYLQIGDNKLPYELVISGSDKKLSGYSLLVFTFDGVENVGVKTMVVKMKRANISIEDGELIYDNYTTPPKKVKFYGSLVWVGRDSNMTLAGTFATRSLDMRALNENSFKGTIHLQKKNAHVQTKLVSKLSEMDMLKELSFGQQRKKEGQTGSTKVKIKEPDKGTGTTKTRETIPVNEKQTVKATETSSAGLAKRETEIIQTVSFRSDSLKISLYDNGEVDGDTVSVILNGKLILSKKGLTANAITETIHVSDLGDSLELIMYAENLGKIPPNTGLLILQDGSDRYYIRFSGDLQKNSAIILKRKR